MISDPLEADAGQHIREALADTKACGRLLLTGDPTMRRLSHHQVAVDSDTAGPPATPVVLVEPVVDRVMPLDQGRYSLTMAIPMKLGLTPFRPYRKPETAANWVIRDGTPWELLDPTGAVVARFSCQPNPQWRAAAIEQRQVVLLYGCRLGVRPPDGVPGERYHIGVRDGELHASLASGAVLAGSVAYTDLRPGAKASPERAKGGIRRLRLRTE
ncbi:hypothetical protein [Dactylosporangium sp. NPDC048998]|uniref:hypothetical protein n=1 Tax=Dactylosporangium sp. NPDC048998 TaxID=3363976 RepID=UPI00371D8BC0